MAWKCSTAAACFGLAGWCGGALTHAVNSSEVATASKTWESSCVLNDVFSCPLIHVVRRCFSDVGVRCVFRRLAELRPNRSWKSSWAGKCCGAVNCCQYWAWREPLNRLARPPWPLPNCAARSA
jgi:hypothetical protein